MWGECTQHPLPNLPLSAASGSLILSQQPNKWFNANNDTNPDIDLCYNDLWGSVAGCINIKTVEKTASHFFVVSDCDVDLVGCLFSYLYRIWKSIGLVTDIGGYWNRCSSRDVLFCTKFVCKKTVVDTFGLLVQPLRHGY